MNTPYAEVIGDPIAHSKSPLIHQFWLKKCGLAGEYRAHHVLPEYLEHYIAERRVDPDWRGCNVTIPHKIAVMDLIADPGDVRASIGAMNTVLRGADGSIIGTNTDAGGFYTPIAHLDLKKAPVVVVGTGGAAHAVLFALSRAEVGPVTLLARNPLKAAALLARFGLKGQAQALNTPLPRADLLVNATQLGMAGQMPLQLDLSVLAPNAVVYDLVYVPLQTQLLADAEACGLATVDGLEMLVGQAAVAFELFFGAQAPREHDAELRTLLIK